MANRIIIPYEPRYQWQGKDGIHEMLDKARFSVLVAHRRFGKTVGVINHLLKSALTTRKKAARYGYIAPYRNQAKSIAWDYLKHYSAVVPGVKFNEGELSVDYPNGARIRLFGADNAEALRGLYFDGVVLDEVADMKPEVWGEIVRPALSDRKGWAVFIGTPKGQNLFFELYNRALTTDGWFAGMYRADQTGVLDEEELTAAKTDMSENQYRQEYLCDFTASIDNALVCLDDVMQAQQRDYKLPDYDFAPVVLGVDVARFGSDSCCITTRQGLKVLEIKTYKQIDNMAFASVIAAKIDELLPQAVFVDAGRGEGVIDRLRQLGYESIIEVGFGISPLNEKYANKRAEMWGLMSEWLKRGQIPQDNRLVAELTAPTYYYDAANRIALEKKEHIKQRIGYSPDCFVAGTMVLTPSGEIPIEQIKIGQEITTPFGVRKVIALQKSTSETLTFAQFSNKMVLEGKGNHRVFTWNRGWVKLSELCSGDVVETKEALWLWNIQKLLFMRAKRSGFKLLADTINPGGKQRRSDFYTGEFGLTITEIFRKTVLFTTLMVTGLTTILQTLSALIGQSMGRCTWIIGLRTKNTDLKTRSNLTKFANLLQSGMEAKKEERGTLKTVKTHGMQGPWVHQRASVAGKCLKRGSQQEQNSVHAVVSRKLATFDTKARLESALTVAKNLLLINTGMSNVAPERAVTNSTPEGHVFLYNMTLDRDNVYYANGILVENCADSLALTFAYPVREERKPREAPNGYHEVRSSEDTSWLAY